MTAMDLCSDLWCILGVIWLATALWTKRSQERASFSSRLTYGAPVALSFYVTFGGYTGLSWLQGRLYPHNSTAETLGVVLTALGLGFATWARFSIGANWSSAVSVKVDHQLVRTGPYAWVRHPIYSGLLLGMVGTAITLGKIRAWVGLILLWLAFWIKSRMEERFMLKTFGPDYEEYSRSTGALIPRLRRS
ncbi:MAG TPA: isoprenylcysteine carboxylmethyltransferase family protein [Terriglobales bacterium]|nr:isoprenylcysteine carboxylmethyltransferase family protein [Terriglobales bacterium]